MYFNRYLAIRYWMALYFFIDLYWLILLFPGQKILCTFLFIIFGYFVLAMIEQINKYHTHSNRLNATRRYFNAQIVSNVLKIILLVLSIKLKLFYYLSTFGDQLLCGISLLEIIGCFLIKKRIDKIENNQDRYYRRIQEYVKKRGENYGTAK